MRTFFRFTLSLFMIGLPLMRADFAFAQQERTSGDLINEMSKADTFSDVAKVIEKMEKVDLPNEERLAIFGAIQKDLFDMSVNLEGAAAESKVVANISYASEIIYNLSLDKKIQSARLFPYTKLKMRRIFQARFASTLDRWLDEALSSGQLQTLEPGREAPVELSFEMRLNDFLNTINAGLDEELRAELAKRQAAWLKLNESRMRVELDALKRILDREKQLELTRDSKYVSSKVWIKGMASISSVAAFSFATGMTMAALGSMQQQMTAILIGGVALNYTPVIFAIWRTLSLKWAAYARVDQRYANQIKAITDNRKSRELALEGLFEEMPPVNAGVMCSGAASGQ